MKAFLSHSSIDKEIVRSIKKRLQRVWAYFDEDCFEPGEDFRTSIVQHLEDTTLFVLFASKNSLESSWVKYELDEVHWQTITKRDIEILVLSIEELNIKEFPEWMKKGNIIKETNISLAVQIIKNKLFSCAALKKDLYIGREHDMQSFYETISIKAYSPTIFSVVGLNGIGRRTFIKKVLADRYSLKLSDEFMVNEAEGLVELYRKLLDYNIEGIAEDKLWDNDRRFIELSSEEQTEEIARALAYFTEKEAYPILIDNNSMLDENGKYKKIWQDVLKCFNEKYEDCYLVLLHTRYPKILFGEEEDIHVHKIEALDASSTYTLFDALLKLNKIATFDKEQVHDVANYLGGYPPAILNAVAMCKYVGIDIIANDKTQLIDFQAYTFNKYLTGIPLNTTDEKVLTAIYNLDYVSIEILSVVLRDDKTIDRQEIAKSLETCLSYNIIECDASTGVYRIAAPMHVSVSKKCPLYLPSDFSEVARGLIDLFNNKLPSVNFMLVDIIIKAILHSEKDDKLKEFRDFLLPSHLLKAAKKANEAMNWSLAEKYSRKALELDDDSVEARIYLFKALVRQETLKNKKKFNDEENEILSVLKINNGKHYHYLLGFRLWKRQSFEAAIEEYKIAIASKDDSISTHRELAECYYQIGEIAKAKKELDLVMKGRRINNPYILDLASKIAISQNDFSTAEKLMEQQALVDRVENVNHRYASYYMRKGDFERALEYANDACSGKRVLPEMMFLRMNLFIRLKRFNKAEEEYTNIKNKIGRSKIDVLEMLHITLLLEKHEWKAAETLFDKLNENNKVIFMGLKKKILNEKMKDNSITIMDKNLLKEELDKMNKSNVARLEQILL